MCDYVLDKKFEEGRMAWFAGPDRDLFLDVGFFLLQFSGVELVITHALAISTGSQDLEAFDILCRGMDARVKIERLRKSAKRHGGIGPNLSRRLALFEKEFIPLRNKLVHGVVTYSEDEGPRRYFISGIANMPWEELNMGPARTSLKPDVVSSIKLYSGGVWLSYLQKDFLQVFPRARFQTTLEIEKPESLLESKNPKQVARKASQAENN